MSALPSDAWVYLAMPLCMALIGYVTKVLAIRMMFEPIEFRGWGPIGWQGIVPRHAARMASIAVDLMTSRLLSPRDVIDRLDPELIARELEEPLRDTVDEIARDVMAQYQPGLWDAMPRAARERLVRRVQDDAPDVVAGVLTDIRGDIDQVLDLKQMVVTNLVRDKALLNRIFRESGEQEFRFIARSGIYFGFLIGCIQALAWYFTHNPLLLPVFGIFTGWFTDWLALKMVFFPTRPRRFGAVTWQGLFLARRNEVADGYCRLIATELITPHHLFEALLRGPLSDRVFVMVQRHVQRAIDAQSGVARPFVVLAVGSTTYQEMKRTVADKVMERLPQTLSVIEDYTADTLDIARTIRRRMDRLTDEEFMQLIRPAFQADEWKLITAGAVLGGVMGEAQVLLLEYLHL